MILRKILNGRKITTVSSLIKKIKIRIYNYLINLYTKKITSYNKKREVILNNKRVLINSLENNYDNGPKRREFENNTANALAKIDNELYCVNETLETIFDKKDSCESRRRKLKMSS